MRNKGQEHPRRARTEGEHQQLAELARRQHGVVSIRQLRDLLGYSRAAVSRATAAGRLHRLHRGVYAVGHTRLSMQRRCLAATLTCGPGALLSHRSAAWLWEISNRGPAPFEVTAPMSRKARPPIRLHFASNLTLEDRALEGGIPVTALPRTLLDLAATVPLDRLRKALDRVEQRGRFDLRAIESLLERNVGHPGEGRLRRALGIYRPPEVVRSEFEGRFLAAVLKAGLRGRR